MPRSEFARVVYGLHGHMRRVGTLYRKGYRHVLHGAAGTLVEGPQPYQWAVVLHNNPGRPRAVCCAAAGAHMAGVAWPRNIPEHMAICEQKSVAR